jgi:hypothetical protein
MHPSSRTIVRRYKCAIGRVCTQLRSGVFRKWTCRKPWSRHRRSDGTGQHPRRLRLLRWRPAFDVVDRGLAEPARAAEQDSPWHEYRGRGPITKNQVAALLRDYDIRPVVLHPTKRADFLAARYRAVHFEDAFARFLPPEPNIRTLKRGRDGM